MSQPRDYLLGNPYFVCRAERLCQLFPTCRSEGRDADDEPAGQPTGEPGGQAEVRRAADSGHDCRLAAALSAVEGRGPLVGRPGRKVLDVFDGEQVAGTGVARGRPAFRRRHHQGAAELGGRGGLHGRVGDRLNHPFDEPADEVRLPAPRRAVDDQEGEVGAADEGRGEPADGLVGRAVLRQWNEPGVHAEQFTDGVRDG